MKTINIVLTGKMKNTRGKMWEKFERWGIVVSKKVNSQTDYLVTGERPGQMKINDAQRWNKEMITEDEFIEMIKLEHPEYLL